MAGRIVAMSEIWPPETTSDEKDPRDDQEEEKTSRR